MTRVFTQLRHFVAEINYADRRLFELRTGIASERRRGGEHPVARS